jgi:hypothetical protein
MRVLAIPNQRPLPTFHGANADNWRIMRALQEAGVSVACMTWRDYIADDAYLPELTSLVPDYLEFPLAYEREISAKEAKKLPQFASLRRISSEDYQRALDFAGRFEPDLILLLGVNGGELAMDLAATLHKPLAYRSQAIETQYYADYYRLLRARETPGQSSSDARRDRAQLRALSRFEQLVVSRSALTLEISADDLHARVRGSGFNIAHVPPLVSSPASVLPERHNTYDICYVGNLFMPHNQNGIHWFMTKVLPIVLDRIGPQRVVVAGKTTDTEFVRQVQNHAIDVVSNPADVDDIVAGSTVGINPIFAGNGTTLKTLDYLWNGCAVVTTPIGIQGYRFGDPSLPITVTGSTEGFATSIVQRLTERRTISETRAKLQRFSWEQAGPELAGMLERVLDRST